MKKYLHLFLILLGFQFASAQSYDFGIFIGTSFYEGDIAPTAYKDYFKTFQPAVGFSVRTWPEYKFSFRVGFNYGTVTGSDTLRTSTRDRRITFRTRIYEFYGVLEWNFAYWKPGDGAFSVTPYFLGGVNVFRFNPQAPFEGQWINLQPLGTEGQGLPGFEKPYSLTEVGIPIGGGIRLQLSKHISMSFELSARKLFTDYLDDVSGTQFLYNDVKRGNGTLAAKLSLPGFDEGLQDTFEVEQRGNPAKDWYYMAGVTIAYRFSNSFYYYQGKPVIGCPRF
ncbi:MAG: hypothetical protein KTR30_15345 [Saprospiraceae bacterium]|nr:hypothetical protein [Saprospiraceae bacterium]